MVTQPKITERLLFTNIFTLIKTTTQEEVVYLVFGRLLSLGGNFTDLMSMQDSCRITKRALELIPIINTLAGSGEERVFNLFNHLSNEPIFRLNSSFHFLPQNCQPLE